MFKAFGLILKRIFESGAQVKGLKTVKVRELLPRATEEAVHRDYFVLT